MEAREDEQLDDFTRVAAMSEEKKKKKSRETTTMVQLGSQFLEKIRLGDVVALRALKIEELHALLVNASPLEIITKPNEK